MAQQYVTDSGVLTIPGAYPIVKVQNNPSGLSTSGVLMVIGEAETGVDFASETSLKDNAFGPDQVSEFVSKYTSGPLVDAFKGAAAAANDAQIPGTFSRFIALKTNAPTQASGTLPAIGGGTHSTITDKNTGKKGNLISRTVTSAAAEVVPTTGETVLAPPQVSTVVNFRVNGAAVQTTTLTVGQLPSSMKTAIDGLTGVAASGGTNRSLVTVVAGTLSITVDSGFQVHFGISTAWAAVPTVGDILYVPTGSPFATANEGTYVVTSATTARIDAYKLRDAAGAGSARTTPTTESGLSVAATTDIQAFSPVTISVEAGAVVPGLGKSLEIAESGSAFFSNVAFTFAGATSTPVAAQSTFVSTVASPQLIVSGTEYSVNTNVTRQSDGVSEDIETDGAVVLTLGYTGTTASAVVSGSTMTITVVGGAGTSHTITLTDYATVNQLVQYLSSLTGYTAAAADASLGQKAPKDLDDGTYSLATEHGAKTGRIKADGKAYLDGVTLGSSLASVTPVSPATKLVGLPDVSSITFLTGGAKGSTTNANILAALVALEAIRGNFVVTCFSQDATLDIAAGLTDAASTYSIDSINSNVRSHVLQMAQILRRRPRQGFVSYRGTFAAAQTAAGNMASSRVAMFFQDVKDTDAFGTLTQFQPWMAAIKAAGMQAGGFYRPIVNKFINVTGALVPGGGFNDQLDSNLTTALKKGLCPIIADDDGGFRWVSDQTTYTADPNFVFNSIQAVYVGDIISMTTAQRMERAFVGQSVADVSASLALTALEGIMSDMKRLKLIAASDDAPKGFRNATIRITGPSMVVSLEIKLAGAIYFIPITFLVTPVQQSAG